MDVYVFTHTSVPTEDSDFVGCNIDPVNRIKLFADEVTAIARAESMFRDEVADDYDELKVTDEEPTDRRRYSVTVTGSYTIQQFSVDRMAVK